jgi:hypothetical protein
VTLNWYDFVLGSATTTLKSAIYFPPYWFY